MIDTLFQYFKDQPALLIYIGAILGGEEIILTFAFLAAQGLWSVETAFIYCYLGTMTSDIGWFLLGRHTLGRMNFFQRFLSRYERIKHFLKKISNRPFILLFITKFIYGTRIFTIMYVGMEGLSLLKFIGYNIFVVGAWLPIVIGIGWLTGKGVSQVANVYENTGLAIGAILLFIIGTIWARKIFSKRVLHSDNL
jgi:membrane protein DedA with SNARE-associated domain